MKVLFLDIDGVLNSHEWDEEVLCGQIHRDKVQLLNTVLRATGARIVLTSAWRYIVHRGEANLQGIDWLLRSHGVIAGRLLDITRQDTMVRQLYSGDPKTWPQVNERGEQITEWLVANGMGAAVFNEHPYAAIDDMDLGITDCGHPLVKTDGTVGITEREAAELIEILGR